MSTTHKYTGFWSVNNGATYGQVEGSSKNGIRAKLRLILRGNLSPGETGTYRIERTDDCETVSNGEIRRAR